MLLIPPGDDSASLPLGFLQEQTELMSDHQNRMECDQSLPIASTSKPASKPIEGDRDEAFVHNSTVDAAPLGDRTGQPSALAPSSHRHALSDRYLPQTELPQTELAKTELAKTELDGLYALRQAARLKTRRQAQASARKVAFATHNTTDDGALGSYAAPLSPLRERDVLALSTLFQRDDIYAIEADVSHRLLSLLPAPCWEEDVFVFLQEFL